MKNVALLGTGFIASVHLEGWKRLSNAEVVAVYEPDDKAAAAFHRKYPAIPRYKSFSLLLEEKNEVDVVDVCLPTFLHREYTEEACAAGKHVLCEKPMALTVDDAEAMANAARRHGVELMVGHALRFWGEYVRARELVMEGVIGEVLSLSARRLALTPEWSVSGWILDPCYSGGAVLDLHIHDLDFANWVCGKPEKIFAQGARGPRGGWDHACTTVCYPGGAVAHVEGGWLMQGDFPFTMGFCILGSEGILEWEFRSGVNIEERGASNPLFLYRQGKEKREIPVSTEDAYNSEIAYFTSCLENKKAVESATAEDGLAAVRTALAARRSMETGELVKM